MNSDGLTPAERGTLHQSLLELRRTLSESIELARESTDTVSLDEPIGRLSRMERIQQQKVSQASHAAAIERLRNVEAALRLLESTPEDYGTCRDCEEPIGFARMSARPETALCLSCQRERETP